MIRNVIKVHTVAVTHAYELLQCRLKKSNKMQQYADIYLLLNYSTCFGRPSRPSSGVHKTVGAASGTDHTVWGKSFFKVLIWSRLSKRLESPYLITFEQASSKFLFDYV